MIPEIGKKDIIASGTLFKTIDHEASATYKGYKNYQTLKFLRKISIKRKLQVCIIDKSKIENNPTIGQMINFYFCCKHFL